MSLIKCNECGKEISDRAYACPSCGNPINNRFAGATEQVEIEMTSKKWKKKSVWGILFLIVSFIVLLNSPGLGLIMLFFVFLYAFYVAIGRWWTNG